MTGRLIILAGLAASLAACGDRNAPSRAEVAKAAESPLVRLTATNRDAPPNMAELVAIGRKVRAEQAK